MEIAISFVLILSLLSLSCEAATLNNHGKRSALPWPIPEERPWAIYARSRISKGIEDASNPFEQLFHIYSPSINRLVHLNPKSLKDFVNYEFGFFRADLDTALEHGPAISKFDVRIMDPTVVVSILDRLLQFLDKNDEPSSYDGLILTSSCLASEFTISILTTYPHESVSNHLASLSKDYVLIYNITEISSSSPLFPISSELSSFEAPSLIDSGILTLTIQDRLCNPQSEPEVPWIVLVSDANGKPQELFQICFASYGLLSLLDYNSFAITYQKKTSVLADEYKTYSAAIEGYSFFEFFLFCHLFSINTPHLHKLDALEGGSPFGNFKCTFKLYFDSNITDDQIIRFIRTRNAILAKIRLCSYKLLTQPSEPTADFKLFFASKVNGMEALDLENVGNLEDRFLMDKSSKIILKNTAKFFPPSLLSHMSFSVHTVNVIRTSLNSVIIASHFNLEQCINNHIGFFQLGMQTNFGSLVKQIVVSHPSDFSMSNHDYVQISWQLQSSFNDNIAKDIRIAYKFMILSLGFAWTQSVYLDNKDKYVQPLIWGLEASKPQRNTPITTATSVRKIDFDLNDEISLIPAPARGHSNDFNNVPKYLALPQHNEPDLIVCVKQEDDLYTPILQLSTIIDHEEILFPESSSNDNQSYYLIYDANQFSLKSNEKMSEILNSSINIRISDPSLTREYLIQFLKDLCNGTIKGVNAVMLMGRPKEWHLKLAISNLDLFGQACKAAFEILDIDMKNIVQLRRLTSINLTMTPTYFRYKENLIKLMGGFKRQYFTIGQLNVYLSGLLKLSCLEFIWSIGPVEKLDYTKLVRHSIKHATGNSANQISMVKIVEEHLVNLNMSLGNNPYWNIFYYAIIFSHKKIVFLMEAQVISNNQLIYKSINGILIKRSLFLDKYMMGPSQSSVPSIPSCNIYFAKSLRSTEFQPLTNPKEIINDIQFTGNDSELVLKIGNQNVMHHDCPLIFSTKFLCSPDRLRIILQAILPFLHPSFAASQKIFRFQPYLDEVSIQHTFTFATCIQWSLSCPKPMFEELKQSFKELMFSFLEMLDLQGEIIISHKNNVMFGVVNRLTNYCTKAYLPTNALKNKYRAAAKMNESVANEKAFLMSGSRQVPRTETRTETTHPASPSSSSSVERKLASIRVAKELWNTSIGYAVVQAKELLHKLKVPSQWKSSWNVYLANKKGSSYDDPLAMLQTRGQQTFQTDKVFNQLIRSLGINRPDVDASKNLPADPLVVLLIRNGPNRIKWKQPLNSTNTSIWSVPVDSDALEQLSKVTRVIAFLSDLAIENDEEGENNPSSPDIKEIGTIKWYSRIARAVVVVEQPVSKKGTFEQADKLTLNLLVDKERLSTLEDLFDNTSEQNIEENYNVRNKFLEFLNRLAKLF